MGAKFLNLQSPMISLLNQVKSVSDLEKKPEKPERKRKKEYFSRDGKNFLCKILQDIL